MFSTQIAQGLRYGFRMVELRPSMTDADKLIMLKDFCRENDIGIIANSIGQVVITDRSFERHIATTIGV